MKLPIPLRGAIEAQSFGSAVAISGLLTDFA